MGKMTSCLIGNGEIPEGLFNVGDEWAANADHADFELSGAVTITAVGLCGVLVMDCRGHEYHIAWAYFNHRYERLPDGDIRGKSGAPEYGTTALKILVAWAAEELTEGQAAKALGVHRVKARDMMIEATKVGLALSGNIETDHP